MTGHCQSISYIISIFVSIFPVFHAELCVDKKHNFILANSDLKNPTEAMIYNFGGMVYRSDGSPACNNGKPSVLLPGIVTFLQGKLTVPQKYDLVRSGILKMTVKSPNFDDPLCLKGKSQYVALPDKFCEFELCSFIGNNLCELLGSPGVHTLEELECKLGFNRTQILPEPPSLFGISLLDLFSGEFSFGFTLEHDEKVILELLIPTNGEYLQIGVENDHSENDVNETVGEEATTMPITTTTKINNKRRHHNNNNDNNKNANNNNDDGKNKKKDSVQQHETHRSRRRK